MSEKKSQIWMPGTKFVVSESTIDGAYGPGTTGFLAYVKGHDQDYPDVYFLRATIIRRGKGGKPRLESAELSTPIFPLEGDAAKTFLPPDKRKYYVHLERDPLGTADIIEARVYDFLGWAFANALFMQKLAGHARHFRVWPEDGEHVLNKAKMMNEFYNEDPDFVENEFGGTGWRMAFIQQLRAIQATLSLSTLVYLARVAKLEKSASEMLYSKNTPKTKIASKEDLLRAAKFYGGKHDRIDSLRDPRRRKTGLVAEVVKKGDLS
jgi:hypothetical protein